MFLYSRFYIQAKEKMAEIYLNHERNKSKYVACYKELAEKLPGPPTTQLLGDAYMNIHEVGTCAMQPNIQLDFQCILYLALRQSTEEEIFFFCFY